MSLVTNLQNAFTRIGTEFKTIRSEIASGSTADRARANHTGTQSADTVVDGTTNKVLSAAMATKLAGIATGATANQTDTYLLSRTNHTGTQSADTLTDGTTNKAFLATERTKLSGVATGATANSTDAFLLARGNHTGTQLSSTISDLAGTIDAKVGTLANLTTTAKGNTVVAINELKSSIDAVAAGTGAINDSATTTTSTWSSSKINTSINSAVSAVVNGSPAALDTLNELAVALGNDANFATTTATALGNRVRVDAAQAFTGVQKTQARANIDAVYTVDMGDPATDFTAGFVAALA